MFLKLGLQISNTNAPSTGVPAFAWRFASGKPVRRDAGGYWMRVR